MSSKINTYLILLVQEIILYQITSEIERCTEAERLFDSAYNPSPTALIFSL
jgi:hypothetical protein